MQGIVILSLKKPSYVCSAFNLALSIKQHNPDLHITLVSDGEHRRHYTAIHYSVFDWIKDMPPIEYTGENGEFQPGLAKLNLAKYSNYDKTLYVDADSMCFKNLQPLFDKLNGSTFKAQVTKDYTQWTDKQTYKDFFGFEQGVAINSSWIYWEDQEEEVFDRAKFFYKHKFPADKISPKWGDTYPDELFFNGAINQLQVDPAAGFEVMFFGNNMDERTLSKLEEDYFFFTLYGNRTTVRKVYVDWYDRLMFKTCESKGIEHNFKAHQILVGKHLSK